jgi:hypothetical protein
MEQEMKWAAHDFLAVGGLQCIVVHIIDPFEFSNTLSNKTARPLCGKQLVFPKG